MGCLSGASIWTLMFCLLAAYVIGVVVGIAIARR